MDTRTNRMAITMRTDRALMAAVRSFVASPLRSGESRMAWAYITSHAAVDEAVTRDMAYEAAMEFAMQFHPTRVLMMEARA